MQIKSYFARTEEEAMQMARQELGPDALLMDAKAAPPEARHLGTCEVVFALPARAPDDCPAEQASGGPPTDALLKELASFRSQLDEMRRAVARVSTNSGRRADSELSRAYDCLTQARLDPTLAGEILDALPGPVAAGPSRLISKTAGPQNSEDYNRALAAELARRLEADSRLAREGDRAKVVMLIGPPGAGKTTNLVKLAVSRGLAAGKSVHLLSIDTYRIGGAEQLRSFAGILGVGFQAFETVLGLDAALDEVRAKDLVFIDTPGFSAATWEESAELRAWLLAHPQVDTHLVVPASMNAADLQQVIDRFRCFRPSKLLFTRLDETACWGTIVSESVRTAIPLSFLSTGQSIPEDLEAAVPERLVQGLLATMNEPARAAA